LLLVDDVCTTGATLQSCAETLMQAGSVSVGAVTLARAIVPERHRNKNIFPTLPEDTHDHPNPSQHIRDGNDAPLEGLRGKEDQ
jgi:hypothetical protein